MKIKLLLSIAIFSCFLTYSQSSDCLNAQPFCTGNPVGFPASTNTIAPVGPDYGCLFTQPNPAFYILEIDQPGDIDITIQGVFGPPGTVPIPNVNTNDIDFICWGPFIDPTNMCDNLTAVNTEDCSYDPTWSELCEINGALTGEFYILLITNFSNANCNIDFSQSGGTGSTSCCLAGDAGIDNSVDFCNSDPTFIMENQLAGSPNIGGTWYDDVWWCDDVC